MNSKQIREQLATATAQIRDTRHPLVYVEVAGEAHEVTAVEAEPDNSIIIIHINEEPADI